MAGKLKVTFIRSTIKATRKQKECIRSLGLRKLHQVRVMDDNPVNRGMLSKVVHLVKVEELKS